MMRIPHAVGVALAFTIGAAGSGTVAAAEQAASTNTSQATKSEAVREHLDEAEDIVESMLRWQHVPIWPVERTSSLPVDAPKNTLISVDQQEVARLTKFLDAMAAQVPASAGGSAAPRGDLRAHIEKAQMICKELTTGGGAAAAGKLVTIDRTALQRLEIELDAIEELLPRALPRS